MLSTLRPVRFALAFVPLALLLASAPAQEAATERGRLVVRLPATAQLTINGQPTSKTGAERTFTTPALAAGHARDYTLVATWTERGRRREETRDVTVRAGARVVVDFTVAQPPEKLTVRPEPKPPIKPVRTRPMTPADPEQTPGKTQPPTDPSAPKQRKFLFSYVANVVGLKPEQKARLWLPIPQANAEQDVEIVFSTSPEKSVIDVDPLYGNRIFSTEGPADKDGKIAVRFVYRVTRREVKGPAKLDASDDDRLLQRYLQADAKVPIDGKPLDLLKGKTLPDDPLQVARALYDVVHNHMRYSKEGTGWGQGDAVWACEHGYGNCSDFHSLFIALARAKKLPAKFEMGFGLPPERGQGALTGYHCWAKFRAGASGWTPVDISEASKAPMLKDYYFGNLSPDRVTFTTGRDINLVPKQAGPPLNFFVYPYVEVDGQRYTNVETRFSYKDE